MPGKFASVSTRLGHLKKLGVNAIQIMPIAQFAGERSWGYNPSHIFSVETDYGGPLGFKRFVKRTHEHGIAVILDVVYNHLGPERPRSLAVRRLVRERSRRHLLL